MGRAQLLKVLDRLPRDQWPAAAAALGYVQRTKRRKKKKRAGYGSKNPYPPPRQQVSDSADSSASTVLPDLPFWRIAADRPVDETDWPTGAPAWLTAPDTDRWQALPEADLAQPIPQSIPLAPPPRQARFLRQALAQPGTGAALDLPRLCRQLAERRVTARLPRLARPVWPGRVQLVVDLADPLTPYHTDFWRWAGQLRQILGRRCRCLLARRGHPGELEDADTGAPAHLWLADSGQILILSDAGLHAPDSPRHRHWRELGERCARQGQRPLLLAPCPARDLSPEIATRFRCVLLERGAPLRPQGARPIPLRPVPDRDREEPSVAADLLAAVALGARTEPPLLRDLRLLLAGRGSDIGWEYAVWNHPHVIADALACALRPEHRAAALERLPGGRLTALATARSEGNRHLSPLVRMEEALVAGALAGADQEPARAQASAFAATLFGPADDRLRSSLTAFIAGLGRRRPELLGQCPALALAWGLAHRERLRGAAPPPLPRGLGLQSLAWLLEGARPPRPVRLGQVGAALGVYSLPAAGAVPSCPLAELETDRDYWQVDPLPAGARPAAEPQVLHTGESLPLDPTVRYRFTIGRRQLDLEAVRRPDWASGLGRDPTGLFAELPDGRRLYWMPKGRLVVGEGAETGLDLPHGGWWDAIEYRAWLDAGRRLMRPDWAGRHGVDPSGWWAEFEVKGVVQRMRWLPPGEFLMGSPADEPERFAEGEWAETQHQVILTQGFWLADTACSQALWQAVLGDNPSEFKGPDRPVEQVNWTDVVERFLPALDALVPGLEAVLPSEAQWEYACRAGTQTPFSFGATITTDQVNYDGNYPYADGAKGEYREQTVEVKALPANDWGLYQMHGNVWEWCADWLGDYPREEVVDPVGPSGGRRRVWRGGSWIDDGAHCRSADRDADEPVVRRDFYGFRLSRGPSPRPAGSAGAAGVAAGGRAPAAAPAVPAQGTSEETRPGTDDAQPGSATGALGAVKAFLDKWRKR